MELALSALSALPIPIETLLAIINGESVVVPVEATAAQIMSATLATGDDLEPTTDEIRAIYRAMIEARPT